MKPSKQQSWQEQLGLPAGATITSRVTRGRTTVISFDTGTTAPAGKAPYELDPQEGAASLTSEAAKPPADSAEMSADDASQ